jgi:hypothetical protein
MSTLVLVVYLAALAIPLLLLYRFHAQSWYWHILCVAIAFALGFVPTPPEWKTQLVDMLFGFTFIFLLVWGLGGLVAFHGQAHSERHHHA